MSVLKNSSNVKVSSRVFQITKNRCRATVHPHLSDEEVGQHGVLDAQGGGGARSVKILSALSISDSILSISGWSPGY